MPLLREWAPRLVPQMPLAAPEDTGLRPETVEDDHGRATEGGGDGGTSPPNGWAALGQHTNQDETEEEIPTRKEDGDPGTQLPATDIPRSGDGGGTSPPGTTEDDPYDRGGPAPGKEVIQGWNHTGEEGRDGDGRRGKYLRGHQNLPGVPDGLDQETRGGA